MGVTYSPAESVILSLRPWASVMLATAGAGTGITPCWHLMHPVPSYRSEKHTSETPRLSMQTPRETMSTTESTAPTSWKWTCSRGPTSWKWTCSRGTPWAFASASPMMSNILLDTDFAFSVMSARSMMDRISGNPL